MSAAASDFTANVPRCIGAFRARRLNDIVGGGHGESLNSSFLLACPGCGGEQHTVRGYITEVERGGRMTRIFVNALRLACDGCTFTAKFFDSDTDGYDPEACSTSSSIREEGEEGLAVCSCGHTHFAAVTCHFAFPDDLTDMEEVQHGTLKAENLFTWFKVGGRCAACGETAMIADFECA
jgi:hypothetical protein